MRILKLALCDSLDGIVEVIKEEGSIVTGKWIEAEACYSGAHVPADAFKTEFAVDLTDDEVYSYEFDEMDEAEANERRAESIKIAEYKDEFYFGGEKEIAEILKYFETIGIVGDNIPAEMVSGPTDYDIFCHIPYCGQVYHVSCYTHRRGGSEAKEEYAKQLARRVFQSVLYETKCPWKDVA